MKGKFAIKITQTNETWTFPRTKSFAIEEDNVPESIDEIIWYFKVILYFMSYTPKQINDIFGEDNG